MTDAAARRLNLDALGGSVPAADIKEFIGSNPEMFPGGYYVGSVIIGLLVAAFFALGGTEDGGDSVLASVILFVIVFVITQLIGITYLRRRDRAKAADFVRAMRLADSNGFTFASQVSQTAAGMFFTVGDERKTYEVVSGTTDGTGFELGNISYVTGSGRSRHVTTLGYARIRLPRNLPNIVLDGRANNTNVFGASFSNLPVTYRGNQKLALEGDFNKYFTLYVPQGYEADALYVFTPDLMALFIDNLQIHDAEIIDDSLIVYGKTLHYSDASQIRQIFSIIDVVGAKTVGRTDMYADERTTVPSQVAEQGRRLKTRVSILAIALSLLIAGYYLFHIATTVLGLFRSAS